MGNLIDSSIFMATERRRFDWRGFERTLGDEAACVSVVTIAELAHGVERADSAARREKRSRSLEYVESRFPVLPFTRAEALEYARIFAEMERTGEGIGAFDLFIAATALCHGHRVATLNARHFKRVPGLEVIDAEEFRCERPR